ncbi:hypothetical protein W01_24010 [Candidatus Nitrotoga sp. AM1P]|nr:hypothetical protein W01_24010 [Candidatus Nitrotoga sp. AM1P]
MKTRLMEVTTNILENSVVSLGAWAEWQSAAYRQRSHEFPSLPPPHAWGNHRFLFKEDYP